MEHGSNTDKKKKNDCLLSYPCLIRVPSVAIQNFGIVTRSPPFIADWCAQIPTIVQFADVAASGSGGRSPRIALSHACTRCGGGPPWPPPWTNDRGSAAWIAAGWGNFRVGSGR